MFAAVSREFFTAKPSVNLFDHQDGWKIGWRKNDKAGKANRPLAPPSSVSSLTSADKSPLHGTDEAARGRPNLAWLQRTLPATPTILAATAISKTQINLVWTDNEANEDGVKIERCSGASCANFSQIATVSGNIKNFSNTGLKRNTKYRYRVRAFNASGNSAYSNIASAKTPR